MNLRERAFLRAANDLFLYRLIPQPDSLAQYMKICRRRKEIYSLLSELPLGTMSFPRGRLRVAELTLHPALQDLADILSLETDNALRVGYYPQMPDVHVPMKHVRRVMIAMQREIDGEAAARLLVAPQLAAMPWERQCALAQRRRYWYRVYGITPRNYRKQVWSVWKVQPIPTPKILTELFN